MKERPIIFSGPSVIAIQQNRKTQTRRIIKPSMRNCDEFIVMECFQDSDALWPFNSWDESEIGPDGCDHAIPCPFGDPGDRLWVRETWATRSDLNHVEYRASHQEPAELPFGHIYDENTRWNNAMFMPRNFARLILEITEVRVQPVQEIDEADAQREGWAFEGLKPNQSYDPVTMDTARQWYRSEWDRINAKRGFPWSANPWVWAVSFKRITETPHA